MGKCLTIDINLNSGKCISAQFNTDEELNRFIQWFAGGNEGNVYELPYHPSNGTGTFIISRMHVEYIVNRSADKHISI